MTARRSPDHWPQAALVLVVSPDGRLPAEERAEDRLGARRARHGGGVVVDERVAVVTRVRAAHLRVAVQVGHDGRLAEDDLTLDILFFFAIGGGLEVVGLPSIESIHKEAELCTILVVVYNVNVCPYLAGRDVACSNHLSAKGG